MKFKDLHIGDRFKFNEAIGGTYVKTADRHYTAVDWLPGVRLEYKKLAQGLAYIVTTKYVEVTKLRRN